MADTDEKAAGRRLAPILRDFWLSSLERSFEKWFILCVLLSVAAIEYVVEQKLPFLNFFFIPVLLAGYFLDVRSAVLGSVLAILWVAFGVVMDPESFMADPTRMSLSLHFLTWASFLVLCGILVGRLNEKAVDKFARMKSMLEDWRKDQARLEAASKSLEDRNQALDGLRAKLETVLYSSGDGVAAHLALTRPVESALRDVSALSAGVVGLPPILSGAGPDKAVEALNRLLGELEPVVTAYRGHISQCGPMALSAEFGLFLFSRHSALLAVLAALKLQEKAGRGLGLKIGVSSGQALIGLIGAGGRRGQAACGAPLDNAARLRELCPAGAVCVDEEVYRRVGGVFQASPVVDAAGETAYLVLGLLSLEEPVPASALRRAASFYEAEGLKPDLLLPLEALAGCPGHSQACAALSLAMAASLGLSEKTIKAVFLAGFYHDIGLRNLPERLACLDRSTAATPEDLKLLRSHPLAARAVLADLGIALPEEALKAVREHLEDYDGRSSPLGLKGERIVLGARVVRIAHEYDVLTSRRPGREPWSPAAALAALRVDAELSGTLDPQILDALVAVLGAGSVSVQ